MQYLLKHPMIEVNKVIEITEVSQRPAYSLIEYLEILKEVNGARRGKIYVFKDYLNLYTTS